MRTNLLLGTVVLPDRLLEGGVVAFGSDIVWVGPYADLPAKYMTGEDVTPVGTKYITPGFIDVHCHGGGGASFPDATKIAEVETAAEEHLRAGTTTLVASLVTAPLEQLVERAELLAEAAKKDVIKGIHFEGPFLSQARCGAQDPEYLRDPTTAVMRDLIEAAGGYALSMTLAPERTMTEGGTDSLRVLTESGAIPSWGHTDGGIQVTDRAIRKGVELLAGTGKRASVTHLFNGMPPQHHREPGPASSYIRAAAAGELVVELICDGVHVDPQLVANVVATVGARNAVFVTDAMAAAGMADGQYVLGPQGVRVKEGVARLLRTGSLAGGTSHISDCVKTAVHTGGMSIVDAVNLGSAQGAALFGWRDRGQLREGLRADACALDAELNVLGTIRGGAVV